MWAVVDFAVDPPTPVVVFGGLAVDPPVLVFGGRAVVVTFPDVVGCTVLLPPIRVENNMRRFLIETSIFI